MVFSYRVPFVSLATLGDPTAIRFRTAVRFIGKPSVPIAGRPESLERLGLTREAAVRPMRGPLVVVAVFDEVRANRVEVYVRCGDRKMPLGAKRLRIVALFEEFPRGSVALVPNLCVRLRDLLDEAAEGRQLQRTQQDMNMVRHQTQRVKTQVRVGQMPVHQADEVEIIPPVGEEPAPIVAPQHDVMRNPE